MEKTLVIKDSPNKAVQILEDRYTQQEAQTEQQMFCVEGWNMSTSPKPILISQQATSGSVLKLEPSLLSTRLNNSQCNGNLTTYPVANTAISQSPKCSSVETLQQLECSCRLQPTGNPSQNAAVFCQALLRAG